MHSLVNRRSIFILTWCLILVSLLSLAEGNAAQRRRKPAVVASPTPTPTPTLTPEPALEIPVSQILAQAEELRARLEQASKALAPSKELTAIEQTLQSQQATIKLQQQEAEELLASSLNLSELDELDSEWKSQKSQYAAMQNTLAARIKAAEDDIKYIDAQMAQWDRISKQVQNVPELETISKKAQDSLTDAQGVRAKVAARISELLALQKQAFQQDEVVTAILGKIVLGKEQFRRGIWEVDGPPLWKLPREDQTDARVGRILHKSLRLDWLRAKSFYRADPAATLVPTILFLILSLIAFSCRSRVTRWSKKHPEWADSVYFLNRPFSLVLLAVLTATILSNPSMPTVFKTAVLLLFMIPILRFVPSHIQPAFRPPLYALIAFGLTISLWNLIEAAPFVELSITALLTLVAISVIGWLSWRGKKLLEEPHSTQHKIVIFAINTGLVLLFLSFLGILFGYITLSQVLRSGAILSAYHAVALFAVVTCFTKIAALVWEIRREKTFSTLRQHEAVIAKWGRRLLILAAFTLWLSATLKLFTVRELVSKVLSNILTFDISVGKVSFSPGAVLTFVLLFVLGVLAAKIVEAILREDVLVKVRMQPGLPYAISTIVYYVLLLAVFLFSLSAAGVELSRFTLLTGAFGVGAGFGMQNILNNFISGIILLFERPIRVGDIANVGTTEGVVEGIGSRSCRLRNWEGAMVIVPNSILISEQVMNWSMVGKGRRITLRFKSDYRADPEQVVRILTTAASSIPGVRPSPSPLAIFLGYGENSLEFDLLFWVQWERLPLIKGDVAVKVSEALAEAGIKAPLPRELLVRNNDSLEKAQSSEQDAEK